MEFAMSSVFQARHGEDAYAVGRFIVARAQALGLSRTDLVRRLGYTDLNSGHRALGEFILTGITPTFIEKKLAHALEGDQGLLDAVLVATARQIRDEAGTRILAREDAYRAAFRPHLQIQTERSIPSPIFIAALMTTKRLRLVAVPDDTFSAGEDERDRTIKMTIISHYHEQQGHVSAFGAITGYVLVLLPGYAGTDFGLPYDCHGDPAGPMRTVKRLPEAILGTKRGDTRLTGFLKDTPIRVLP
jgi:hypothetical protein